MSALCFLASVHMDSLFVGWSSPLALIDMQLMGIGRVSRGLQCHVVPILTVTMVDNREGGVNSGFVRGGVKVHC